MTSLRWTCGHSFGQRADGFPLRVAAVTLADLMNLLGRGEADGQGEYSLHAWLIQHRPEVSEFLMHAMLHARPLSPAGQSNWPHTADPAGLGPEPSAWYVVAMPRLKSREIGVAFDMHGCPNRCRHCGVGFPATAPVGEEELRWVVGQFRQYTRPGEDRPLFERISVASWIREPDYSDDYRRLHELEIELSSGPPERYELLSIWRLARDPMYAAWAKSVGPITCQVSFFGLEQNQDWFHRRSGTFRDSILATERLLEAGIKPRWQLFLTQKILPDLSGLMHLVEAMRLRQRVEALGGEFAMFIHAPGLTGEGMHLAELSVTLDQTRLIPAELVASTRRHFAQEMLWTTEAQSVDRALHRPEEAGAPYSDPPKLWFQVTGRFDVYSNLGSTDPWWKLGNLKQEGVGAILERYEQDQCRPYQLNRIEMLPELARRYGDPSSQRVVNSIEQYWVERCCAEGA